MGHRNLDRWPAEAWRGTAETVGQMRAKGWEVISYCRACHLTMRVDLALIERVSGAEVSLWNRQSPCRRLGCAGIVEFHGKPPELLQHVRLVAGWPDQKPGKA